MTWRPPKRKLRGQPVTHFPLNEGTRSGLRNRKMLTPWASYGAACCVGTRSDCKSLAFRLAGSIPDSSTIFNPKEIAMTFEEALAVVLELARENALDESLTDGDETLIDIMKEQHQAISAVEAHLFTTHTTEATGKKGQ